MTMEYRLRNLPAETREFYNRWKDNIGQSITTDSYNIRCSSEAESIIAAAYLTSGNRKILDEYRKSDRDESIYVRWTAIAHGVSYTVSSGLGYNPPSAKNKIMDFNDIFEKVPTPGITEWLAGSFEFPQPIAPSVSGSISIKQKPITIITSKNTYYVIKADASEELTGRRHSRIHRFQSKRSAIAVTGKP